MEEGLELDGGAVLQMRPRLQPRPGRSGSSSIRAGGAALRLMGTGQQTGLLAQEEVARPLASDPGRNARVWGFKGRDGVGLFRFLMNVPLTQNKLGGGGREIS